MSDEEVELLASTLRDASMPEAWDEAVPRLTGSTSAPALLSPAAAVGAGRSALDRRAAWGRQVWIDTAAVADEAHESDRASFTSPSRPSSRLGTSSGYSPFGSSCSSRPASRRFSQEELNCFRRVHTPSGHCEAKQEVYFQTQGKERRAATELGLASLPVLKGKFYSLPSTREQASPTAAEKARLRREARRQAAGKDRDEKLKDEDLTSSILNEIYPVKPDCPPVGRGQDVRPSTSGARSTGCGSDPTGRTPMGAVSGRGASRPTLSRAATVSAGLVSRAPNGLEPIGGSVVMLEFRSRLLEKYATINEAHKRFAEDVPSPDHGMTKKEWRRLLSKQGFEWPNKEKDMLFEDIDCHHEGHVSLSTFHIAVEAAAPVRSLEDLRRRWLAKGFKSMTQAIKTMDESVSRRLSFEDFCVALKRVNVHDPSEHQALFAAVCSDPAGKVSIAELTAAIATVSPALLLEDVRFEISKLFMNNWTKAYFELDMDKGGTIEAHEFVPQAVRRMGLKEAEARKAFRLIDVDNDGEITRNEFVSAITLAEPSLFLEDLRLKIRRCFRSIQESFHKTYANSLTGEIEAEKKLSVSKFQELLVRLDLTGAETQMLFDLIDTAKDGELTVAAFVRGVHHFAPACALEDLRVRCVQRSGHVSDPFAQILDKTRLMDVHELAQTLKGLDLIDPAEAVIEKKPPGSGLGVPINLKGGVLLQGVFDLLDVEHVGTCTLGRLLAALQSSGAGSRMRLQPKERDMQASRDMRDDLWLKHKLVNDLKFQVRMGVKYDEWRPDSSTERHRTSPSAPSPSPRQGQGQRAGSPAARSPERVAASVVDLSPQQAANQNLAGPPPRLRTVPHESLAMYMDQKCYQALRNGPDPQKPTQFRAQEAQDSLSGLWKALQKVAPADQEKRRKLQGNLHHYFQSTAMSMSHDVPLVSGVSHSSMEQYLKMKQHKAALRMA